MSKIIKPRGSIVAALDIGSSKIACLIGRVVDDTGTTEILGVGHQASKGIKNGNVVDLDEAEAAIRQCVHTAENMAADIMKGFPLRDVIINVPGTHASSQILSADIQVHGEEIEDGDVKRALAKAQNKVISDNQELIHTIPVGFSIDGRDGVRDPRGMVGQSLDVGIHVVLGELNPLQNIIGCIEDSHLDIEALCLSSYAAGLSTLVEDEMDLGCTVIDLGGGVSSFAVFQNGSMIYSDAIAVGGWQVTNDIARGLTCSISDAERLKTLYGSAIVSTSDDHELIDFKQLGEDDQSAIQHIPRSLLIGIIQPRLEEILEIIRGKLQDSGLGSAIGRRVVLTGGGSQIPGLRDLAQLILDKQIRLGRPIRVNGLPDAVSGPAFATTAGLLNYLIEKSDEMPSEIMSQGESQSLLERFSQWWKENW